VPTLIILSAVTWFTFYSYQMVIGDPAIKQDWQNSIKKSKWPAQAIIGYFSRLLVQLTITAIWKFRESGKSWSNLENRLLAATSISCRIQKEDVRRIRN
jgi:hypothetical protein